MTKRMREVWRLEVEWIDSQIDLSGWTPVVDLRVRLPKRARCHSVGYALVDDERGVLLAGSVNGANAVGAVWIPASQIVERRRLK